MVATEFLRATSAKINGVNAKTNMMNTAMVEGVMIPVLLHQY